MNRKKKKLYTKKLNDLKFNILDTIKMYDNKKFKTFLDKKTHWNCFLNF